ncbi:response regulator [Silvibacterium dinghuense]|nr:response regulator [Silvibacterium dinghuense]GGG94614.1 hypothetical protein GCM10011586_06920 [Silvibacterium dinghuense]
MILGLRDQILRVHGYQVDSTLDSAVALELSRRRAYDLVVIDVEGDGRIALAEELCQQLKEQRAGQDVVFICNYRVSQETDCPDEVIRAEFNPKAMVAGIEDFLRKRD